MLVIYTRTGTSKKCKDLQVGNVYEGEVLSEGSFFKIGEKVVPCKDVLILDTILLNVPHDSLQQELARRRYEATTKWKFGINC
jgi:hypothetical protein